MNNKTFRKCFKKINFKTLRRTDVETVVSGIGTHFISDIIKDNSVGNTDKFKGIVSEITDKVFNADFFMEFDKDNKGSIYTFITDEKIKTLPILQFMAYIKEELTDEDIDRLVDFVINEMRKAIVTDFVLSCLDTDGRPIVNKTVEKMVNVVNNDGLDDTDETVEVVSCETNVSEEDDTDITDDFESTDNLDNTDEDF